MKILYFKGTEYLKIRERKNISDFYFLINNLYYKIKSLHKFLRNILLYEYYIKIYIELEIINNKLIYL